MQEVQSGLVSIINPLPITVPLIATAIRSVSRKHIQFGDFSFDDGQLTTRKSDCCNLIQGCVSFATQPPVLKARNHALHRPLENLLPFWTRMPLSTNKIEMQVAY